VNKQPSVIPSTTAIAHERTSRLVLVRHCAAQSQAPEAALTPEGVLAAKALVDLLAGFELEAVYSSPYARAIATITPFAERVQLSIQLDERLRERTLAAESLPDWLAHLERSHVDIDHCAPGGESLREVRARGLGALCDIASRHRCSVVVSHGQWLASVLSQVDPAFGFAEWRALRNPDLFVVDWADDAPLRFERVAHERRGVRYPHD
jgi:2,3-bisphosphoglycerate-dependent phosphoglycerate mutase